MITRKITVALPNSTTGQTMNLDIVWFEVADLSSMTALFCAEWAGSLKESIALMGTMARPPICLVCGRNLTFDSFDLHHGIVTRQDIRGWRYPNACMLINTELNLVPLHPSCHLSRPPSREEVWEYQANFYGQLLLVEWYRDLPWKTQRPPRLFRGM